MLAMGSETPGLPVLYIMPVVQEMEGADAAAGGEEEEEEITDMDVDGKEEEQAHGAGEKAAATTNQTMVSRVDRCIGQLLLLKERTGVG